MKRILISPAHYFIDPHSQSEYYFSAKILIELGKKRKDIQFTVICGRAANYKEFPDNIRIIQLFKDSNRGITFSRRILFYLLLTFKTVELLRKNSYVAIWHLFPNGPYSFNPVIFFNVDRFLQPNIYRIIGRLQYADNFHLKEINKKNGIVSLGEWNIFEKILFKSFQYLLGIFSRYYYSKFNKYIFNNKPALDFYKNFVGLKQADRNWYTIPVGIDLDQFPYFNHSYKAPHKFVVLGNLTRDKNVSVVIRICSYLRTMGYPFHLRIIGDGPERNALTSLIHDLSLEDFISIEEAIPKSHVAKILRESEVLFMLGTAESFSQVTVEAMSSGTLCVIADTPVTRCIISEESGILVDTTKGERACEECAKTLADLSKKIYSKLTYEAKLQSELYAWPKIASMYEKNILSNL